MKVLSPTVHGVLDYASRNFFVAAGVALLGVVAITNYRAAELDHQVRRPA